MLCVTETRSLTVALIVGQGQDVVRSVRLSVVLLQSEMSESSGLKEADLLDATVCLYKLGADIVGVLC